jgi:actin-like ATPase involved in cell morphogenesis
VAYYLGIDIGTTYSAAAVWRDGQVTVANLGERAPVVPSVLFVAEDGTLLIGEAAERRGPSDPRRMAREFKRRVGDPTPIIVAGTPYSADALMSKLLRWIVDKVATTEGALPDGVAVSHPANWGAFKQDLLAQEIRLADLTDVVTLTEPEAAAIYYASQERVAPGAVVAVYDLGGGTFDVAILRKVENGWHILGEPEGIERLGGIDFDEAVFQHVTSTLGEAYEALDPEDDATLSALVRLRRECVEAKEALSEDTDVSIPVLLPGIQRDVRLTRVEFEDMVKPALTGSIEATKRALREAKVATDEVTAVLLVGGSSRVPLVGQLVGAELGRPVAIDVHPKYGIALGAAILAAEHASDSGLVTSQITAIPSEAEPVPDGSATAAAGADIAAGLAGAAGMAGAAGLAALAGADAGSLAPGAGAGGAGGAAAEGLAGGPGDAAGDAAAAGLGEADSSPPEAAFDAAAEGPPVGDGPEVPVEAVPAATPAVADVDAIDAGPPTAPLDAATTDESPVPGPGPAPGPVGPEAHRTVRIPAPVAPEPTVTAEIRAPVTADMPVVPIGPARNGVGGGGSGGYRRPPGRGDNQRGRQMLLLAGVAAAVIVLAGVLFTLRDDGSGADTETGGTATSEPSTTEPSTTTSTEPSTTTSTDEPTTTTTLPPPVEVTDVTNLPEGDATSALEADGFTVSREEEPSDTVDAGNVIRTDPAAGTEADSGSEVTIFVSTGPEEVTVPGVVGTDEGSAISQIEAAGLVANPTPTPVDDPTQEGLVLDQNPAADASVAAGTTVDISIGAAP